MNKIFKMNGKRIRRKHVETYWQDGLVVTVTLVSGNTETKTYPSADEAEKAIKVLDNLTQIDDIDGL